MSTPRELQDCKSEDTIEHKLFMWCTKSEENTKMEILKEGEAKKENDESGTNVIRLHIPRITEQMREIKATKTNTCLMQ